MLLKTKQKTCDTVLKVRLCRKKLHGTNNIRYLDIQIAENLNWKIYIHDLISKLNRASAVLSKLRYFATLCYI